MAHRRWPNLRSNKCSENYHDQDQDRKAEKPILEKKLRDGIIDQYNEQQYLEKKGGTVYSDESWVKFQRNPKHCPYS
jgi:hypothetical protein